MYKKISRCVCSITLDYFFLPFRNYRKLSTVLRVVMIENRISNSLANGFLVNQLTEKKAPCTYCVWPKHRSSCSKKIHKETFKKGNDSD